MGYNFDAIINRQGTLSLKWDNPKNNADKPDVLPFWVADMDFPPPPEVVAALQARAAHPIYGYTNLPQSYLETIVAWYASQGRTVEKEDILPAPGLMLSISQAVRTFTEKGDRILIMPPVYYPFFKVVRGNHRSLVESPLLLTKTGKWEIDWAGLENRLEDCRKEGRPVKALLFCSPHNPVGRVWTPAEINRLSELSKLYGFLIFSDEIHSDLVFAPHKHTCLLDHDENLASRTLVFTSPNKTFNLAGLLLSHIIVRQPELKAKMKQTLEADFFDQPNVFALTAAQAAYAHGRPWLDALLPYLQGNYEELKAFFRDRYPEVKVADLEGTYLAWVDVREFLNRRGYNTVKELADFLENEARVKFSAGTIFQTGGEGHLRVNLAAPRPLLREGLDRMIAALEPKRLKN